MFLHFFKSRIAHITTNNPPFIRSYKEQDIPRENSETGNDRSILSHREIDFLRAFTLEPSRTGVGALA